MRFQKQQLLIIIFGLILGGCGNKEVIGTGKIATSTRKVSEFSGVNVSGSYNIIINRGNPQSVTIKSNENLLPYIETNVKSDSLVVKTEKGVNIHPQTIPSIEIVVPNLKKIELSGSNSANATSIAGEEFEIKVDGFNQCELEGKINSLKINGTGDVIIDAPKLVANNVDIQASGNSKITVNASNKLNVNLSGSGEIQYIGNPSIKQNIAGTVSIKKIVSAPPPKKP